MIIVECASLAAKWNQLSGFIGLRSSLIDQIRCDYPNDSSSCWNEALKEWIKQNYNISKFGKPSWKTLLGAIFRIDKHLFAKLASEHKCRGPIVPTTSASEEKLMLEPESENTSSAKTPDTIKQIDEKKITDDGKEESAIGSTTPSAFEAASVLAPSDARAASTGMSYKDTCSEISTAINMGAPEYNKGDHKGCYERYKEAGEKIVDNCTLSGIQQQLRSAIELANKQSSFTKQAWTMRHAFEIILFGNIDTSNFTESDKEELLKSTGTEMGYKEACQNISTAINRGTPMFNVGDHSGCYDTYRQTAEKIVERCSVAVVQQKLRSALCLAEKEPTFTDQAWTIRRSFDAILRGISDDSIETNDEKGEITDSMTNKEGADEDDKEMSCKEARKVIHAAFNRGVSLYDEGAHEQSFSTYKQAAEKILK